VLRFDFEKKYVRVISWTIAYVLAWAFTAGAQTADNRQNVLIAEATDARTQNDIPRAIELYSKAVQANPTIPDAWWFLGSLQYATGAYAPARDALSHYLQLTPKAAPAFALRGLCEFEIGEYAQSLSDIQQGISLGAANQPRNEQVLRYHQGLLMTRLGNYEGALGAYGFFAKNDITNPDLFVAIGLAGLRMPLLPKDVAPDQKDLLFAAGQAAFQFMATKESPATQSFTELFERFPQARNTHFFYGYLLFATDPDAALDQFKKELSVSPSNSDAEVMTAWALLLRNRAAEALPYAQKAAQEQSSNPTAELVLGRSLLETGDVDAGMQHLQKVLQMDANNLEAHLALAKAYSKSGHEEEARRERMLCLQLTSETPVANP
jgi:tetratricopeptide (TPR) repeat protein